MATLTGATSVFQLAVTGVFPSAQQLQGYAADDVFDVEGIDSSEYLMGVDGILSGGFVFVPIKQNIHLQADSASNALFDTWWTQQVAGQTVFFASATIILPSVGTKWSLSNGLLTQYKPMPTVKKLLQPRTHQITWGQISPSPQ